MIQTSKHYLYKVFGFSVKSEMQLQELIELQDFNFIDNDNVINIVYSDLTKLWTLLNKEKKLKNFVVRDGEIIVNIPDVAIFSIQNGNKIIVSPHRNSIEDKIRLYILGTCMGALLIQRRILPLHGSAVAINGKAYAFIGNSGVGKSTLASAFIQKGYKILSDDVLAISFNECKVPIVTPSYPQQKLWEESLEELGIKSTNYRPLFERETKYSVPVPQNYENMALPLDAVFELSKIKGDQVTINRVESIEKLRILLMNTYRKTFISHLGLDQWHFLKVTKILNEIKVFQIGRPVTSFTSNNLVDSVINELNEIYHY